MLKNEEKLNNLIPLTNFSFTKRWRRMGNGGMGHYTTALFCCSFLFRFSPAAVWGHPWARVLQNKLPLSWGPPQAAGMSMIQHLELILFTLVSAEVFLTFFLPPIHFLLLVPFLKPVSPEMPLLGCGTQPGPAVDWVELSTRTAPHRHCPVALQDQSLATCA